MVSDYGTSCICYNAIGKLLAISSSDSNVYLYDAQSFLLLQTLEHPSGVTKICFNYDDTILVSWSGDIIRKWDIKTGNLMITYPQNKLNCNKAVFKNCTNLEPTMQKVLEQHGAIVESNQ